MKTNTPNICVVGSANMDLLCKVPRLPKMGETLIGHYFKMGCGGKGSNQAIMAAKLGAEVTIVAKLGHDPLGEITYKNYEDQGINTRYIYWDDENSSGVAPIFVDDSGENLIVIVPGANMKLTPEDITKASIAIQQADVLVCQLEIPIETTLQAFRIAKEFGVMTILNPAPAVPIPDELYQLCDILAPNETEAELLTGFPVETIEQAKLAAKNLLSKGCKTVIITLGKRGALISNSQISAHIPTIQVVSIDSTGAGDAFIGSLSYFISTGHSLLDAIEKSNMLASLSVTRVGTQASFPTLEDMSNWLDSTNIIKNNSNLM